MENCSPHDCYTLFELMKCWKSLCAYVARAHSLWLEIPKQIICNNGHKTAYKWLNLIKCGRQKHFFLFTSELQLLTHQFHITEIKSKSKYQDKMGLFQRVTYDQQPLKVALNIFVDSELMQLLSLGAIFIYFILLVVTKKCFYKSMVSREKMLHGLNFVMTFTLIKRPSFCTAVCQG